MQTQREEVDVDSREEGNADLKGRAMVMALAQYQGGRQYKWQEKKINCV